MNYCLKFKGVFWSQSGSVYGDNLTHSWTQMSAVKWLASSHVKGRVRFKLKPSAQTLSLREYQSLQDKRPRMCTERNSTQDWCLGKEHPPIMLNPCKGRAGGQFLQRNSCHNSYLILANNLKWQPALLVEIFKKADYWFHSASPSGKEGLPLERGGKGKAVTARAGEVSLNYQPKGWSDSTSQALLFAWGGGTGGECVYVYGSFRTHKKYIRTSAELPNSLPTHAELSTISCNFS